MRPGDTPCSSCGTEANPVWFTDNTLWNDVVRSDLSEWDGQEPILCIECFIDRTEEWYAPVAWRLLPEWPRADGAADV